MYLGKNERANIYEFFKKNTYYSEEFIKGITNHAQLFCMYNRTKDRIVMYADEIINYYQEHPEIVEKPTNEQIRAMKYEDLSQLRKELGIKKQRKKVVKSIEDKGTADKARKNIRKQTTTKIAAQAIVNSIAEEIEYDDDYEQFLTSEELSMMYPDEDFSTDELAKLGIVETPYFGAEDNTTKKHK